MVFFLEDQGSLSAALMEQDLLILYKSVFLPSFSSNLKTQKHLSVALFLAHEKVEFLSYKFYSCMCNFTQLSALSFFFSRLMTLRRCLCSNCSFPFSFCSFNCIMTNLCKGRLVKGMHVLGTCGCNNLPYNFTGCVPNDISSSPLKTQGHNNTRLVARSFLSYIL